MYLCGVQLWCTMNGFYDKVADMERLHYVLRGIRRLQGNTHIRPPRAPVTVSMLEFMYDAAALFPSAHDCALVRSVVTLAFFGLLRVSEICPPSAGKFSKERHLTVADVVVDLPSRYVAVTLKESKSDPFRVGVTVRVGSLNHRLCPVRAMASYLLVRGSAPGPLFVFGNGALFTRVFLISMLRQWFPTISTVNSHSFRRGGATALAASGASDFTIQLLGRWKSNTYLRYINITDSTFVNPFNRVMRNGVEE